MEEKMFKLVESYKSSTERSIDFCHRHEISQNQLFYWQNKYNKKRKTDSDFVSLSVVNPIQETVFCVHYPNGVYVSLTSSPDAELMRQLITVI